MANFETAPLDREQVEAIIEQMRKNIAQGNRMGITVGVDHNGAQGEMGATYVAVRFDDKTVSMKITQVSCYQADEAHNCHLRQDK